MQAKQLAPASVKGAAKSDQLFGDYEVRCWRCMCGQLGRPVRPVRLCGPRTSQHPALACEFSKPCTEYNIDSQQEPGCALKKLQRLCREYDSRSGSTQQGGCSRRHLPHLQHSQCTEHVCLFRKPLTHCLHLRVLHMADHLLLHTPGRRQPTPGPVCTQQGAP